MSMDPPADGAAEAPADGRGRRRRVPSKFLDPVFSNCEDSEFAAAAARTSSSRSGTSRSGARGHGGGEQPLKRKRLKRAPPPPPPQDLGVPPSASDRAEALARGILDVLQRAPNGGATLSELCPMGIDPNEIRTILEALLVTPVVGRRGSEFTWLSPLPPPAGQPHAAPPLPPPPAAILDVAGLATTLARERDVVSKARARVQALGEAVANAGPSLAAAAAAAAVPAAATAAAAAAAAAGEDEAAALSADADGDAEADADTEADADADADADAMPPSASSAAAAPPKPPPPLTQVLAELQRQHSTMRSVPGFTQAVQAARIREASVPEA